MNRKYRYTIRRADPRPPLNGDWEHPAWENAEGLTISHFHRRSSAHRPVAEARVLYDVAGLYVSFRVRDRYVRCETTRYQGPVCRDACVEFFFQPKANAGYFNFEMNCSGTVLLYYIEDAAIVSGAFQKHTPVDRRLFRRVRLYHSVSGRILQEIRGSVVWKVSYFIPFSLVAHYVGRLGRVAGQAWRGNFYKCASNNSHPHWASWAPIGRPLNFHQPRRFGLLRFAE